MKKNLKISLVVFILLITAHFSFSYENVSPDKEESLQFFYRARVESGFSIYFPNEMDYVFSLDRSIEIDILRWNMFEMWMNFEQNLFFRETDDEILSPYLIRYVMEYFNLALNLDGHYLSIYSDHVCYNTINTSRIPRSRYRTYTAGFKIQNEGLRLNQVRNGIPVFQESSGFAGELHYMAAFSKTYSPFGREHYEYDYNGKAQLRYVLTTREGRYPFADVSTDIFIDGSIKPNLYILLGLFVEESALLNSFYYEFSYLHDVNGYESNSAPFHSVGVTSHYSSDTEKNREGSYRFPGIHFFGGYGKLYRHAYGNHQADMDFQVDLYDSPEYHFFFNTNLSHQSEIQGKRAIGGLSPRYLYFSIGPGISYKIPDTSYSVTASYSFNRYDIGYTVNNVLERYRNLSFSFNREDPVTESDLANQVLLNKASWSSSVAYRFGKTEHPYTWEIAHSVDYFPLSFGTILPVLGAGVSSERGPSDKANKMKLRTGIMKHGKIKSLFYLDTYFNSNPDSFRGEDKRYMLAGFAVQM